MRKIINAGVETIKFSKIGINNFLKLIACVLVFVTIQNFNGYHFVSNAHAQAGKLETNNRLLRGMDRSCRRFFNEFKAKLGFAAFAVSRNGRCGASWDYGSLSEAKKVALDFCKRSARGCKIAATRSRPEWILQGNCRSAYNKWNSQSGTSVFSLGKRGACGWSANGVDIEKAISQAISQCNIHKQDCRIYATRSSVALPSGGFTNKQIQQQLNQLGYNVGKADGKFGAKTKRAIKSFQQAKNLIPDGVAGSETLKALFAESIINGGKSDRGATVSNSNTCIQNTGWRLVNSVATVTACASNGSIANLLLRCDRSYGDFVLEVNVTKSNQITSKQDFLRVIIDGKSEHTIDEIQPKGVQRIFETNFKPGFYIVDQLQSGQRGNIKLEANDYFFSLKNSSSTIKKVAENCSVPSFKDDLQLTGLRIAASASKILPANKIRNVARSFGDSCSFEEAIFSDKINRVFTQLPIQVDKIGSFSKVNWKSDSNNGALPLYLMVSFDKPVRFKGDFFYPIMPGIDNPFGFDKDTDKTRAVIPLSGLRQTKHGEFEFAPLLAGTLQVQSTVFGYQRSCEKFVSKSFETKTYEFPLGAPRIYTEDEANTQKPIVEFSANQTGRKIQVFNNYFELRTILGNERIGVFEGVLPKFSPTGRYISYSSKSNPDFHGKIKIIDAVDGDSLGEISGQFISWSHNDGFLFSQLEIISPLVPERSYYGYKDGGPDGPSAFGIRLDFENSAMVLNYEGNTWTSDRQGNLTRNNKQSASSSPLHINPQSTLASDRSDEVARNEVLKMNPPQDWEFQYGDTLHNISFTWREFLKKEHLRQFDEFEKRHIDPRVHSELLKGNEKSIGKVASVNEAEVNAQEEDWKRVLERENLKFGLALEPDQQNLSDLLASGKVLGEGFQEPGQNFSNVEKSILEDFPKLKCLIGRNFVSKSTEHGRNYFDIGAKIGETPLIRQGNRPCVEKYNPKKHKLLSCGSDQIHSPASKNLGGWKLDLMTNGLLAYRWLIAEKPVWVIVQQCWPETDFLELEARVYTISEQPEPTINLIGTFNDGAVGKAYSDNLIYRLMSNGKLLVIDKTSDRLHHTSISNPKKLIGTEIQKASIAAEFAIIENSNKYIQVNEDKTFFLKSFDQHSASLSGAIKDDEYIVWNKDGLFDSSPEGVNLIRIKFDGVALGVHSFEQFETPLRAKKLIDSFMNNETLLAPQLDLPPELEVRFDKLDNSTLTGKATISLSSGRNKLSVFQDGIQTQELVFPKDKSEIEFSIPILNSTCSVALLAVNEKGLASPNRAKSLCSNSNNNRSKKDVHILSVGINSYNRSETDNIFNLGSAVSDAELFSASLSALDSDKINRG